MKTLLMSALLVASLATPSAAEELSPTSVEFLITKVSIMLFYDMNCDYGLSRTPKTRAFALLVSDAFDRNGRNIAHVATANIMQDIRRFGREKWCTWHGKWIYSVEDDLTRCSNPPGHPWSGGFWCGVQVEEGTLTWRPGN